MWACDASQVFVTVETVLASLLVVILVAVIVSPLVGVLYVGLMVVSYTARLLPLKRMRELIRGLFPSR